MAHIAALATVSVFAGSLAAQQLAHGLPDKAAIVVDASCHRPDLVVVKLSDGGKLADIATVVGERRTRFLFEGLEREVAELRRRALSRMPADAAPPPDLSRFFFVETRGIEDSRSVIRELNRLPAVELAYPEARPTPPPGDVPPVTPNFVVEQAHLAPAPNGFDGLVIQQLTGGWGTGVKLLDIEPSWHFDHEDIAKLRPNVLISPPQSIAGWEEHGTAVLGVLAADPDTFGVSGMTPDVSPLVTPDRSTPTNINVAAAIVRGSPFLQAGDVILLEAQTTSPWGYVPTEYKLADFQAIQTAVLAGMIVVEAAGNGGLDLDDQSKFGRLFDRTFRDSGAILVGATNGVSTTRHPLSNYGSRCDASGWGKDVVTTGYGDRWAPTSTPNPWQQYYTKSFGGTSAASALVAGAVVAMRGSAIATLGPNEASGVTAGTIRQHLQTYGVPTDPNQHVGPRPNMGMLFQATGAFRGLQILDRARIGRSFRIQIVMGGIPGPSDAWLLASAPQSANIGMGPPYQAPWGNRLLLNPATMVPVLSGVFNGQRVITVSIPLPNQTALIGFRQYWQNAVIYGNGQVFLMNSVVSIGEL